MSDDRNKDGEPVGYRKPPKHTRFKKGKSGNPRGRPRKIPKIADLFMKESLKTIDLIEGQKKITVTKAGALVKSVYATAIKKGDVKVLQFLLENSDRLGIQAPANLPQISILDNIPLSKDELYDQIKRLEGKERGDGEEK